jgi:hypothetical protein
MDRRRGDPYFVTVHKVGRKWAEIDSGRRVDLKTLAVDGGEYSSPADCYLSREEYEAEVRRNELFHRLVRRIGHLVNNGVTADDIVAAAKLLRVDLGEE